MKKLCGILLVTLLVVLSCIGLVACNNKIADNTEHYDKITKSLKLTRSYEGKSFLYDGIGEATIVSYTDGDTTRFRLVKEDIEVIIRYYSVNTPESTGSIEKWGKAASNFTKQQLQTAEKVVLEASEDRAVKDSYGQRYLGYVWYKPVGEKEFKNLNLELVENGYSENDGSPSEKYVYYSYFSKANNFAKSIKLRWYSELDDPLFSKDPIKTSIKEMTDNIDAFYNSDADTGSLVEFYAYLSDVRISDTGTYTFTATQVDPDSGSKYTINVYAAYSSSNASRMPIGHYYKIVGNVAKHYDSYQITNITYSTRYDRYDYTKISQRDYMLTFDSQKAFADNWSQTLYTDVTVTSSSLADGVLTIVGTTYQRESSDEANEDATTFTFKVKVPADFTDTFDVGAVFSVQGFQFVADSGEITILNYSDITKK